MPKEDLLLKPTTVLLSIILEYNSCALSIGPGHRLNLPQTDWFSSRKHFL